MNYSVYVHVFPNGNCILEQQDKSLKKDGAVVEDIATKKQCMKRY